MKKTILYLTAVCFTVTLTMSSCTKERIALDLLYGTWRLDSEKDEDGILIGLNPGVTSVEQLSTFYRCSDKQNESCTGSSKTTTVYTNNGTTTTTINTGTFSYRVFQKTQLLINGDVYEIDELKKKDLVIHPVENPLATHTLSKI
jgi:hypothetical protein